MQQMKIRSIVTKQFRVTTTDSKHQYRISPNLLNRNFNTLMPTQVWASDITYIPTRMGWRYLTIIIDLYDRKVVGWSVSADMSARNTVIRALNMAQTNRPVHCDLIFHSDRGVQYACDQFRLALNGLKYIRQSMSRKADCWDNAVAESFFKTIKSELIKTQTFLNENHLQTALFTYIEIWYNRKRRHQYLGYLSPEDFAKSKLKNVA
jgi:transposase InsO family protein